MSRRIPTAFPDPVALARAVKQRRTEEIGATGLLRFGGQVDEEFHNMLRGIRGVRAYREMRDNDATLGASIYAITSLVRQTPTSVRRTQDTPGAEAAAVFLEECLEDMSHTMPDLWAEVLSMIWFGWSYFEKVFKVRAGKNPRDPTRDSRFDDGRIGWRKISIRAQETLDDWEFDEDGGIRGMYQSAAPNYQRVFIPIEKALLFRVERNKNNPEGRSLLRNSWRTWFFLKRMQEIEAIGIERDLVGLPVLELPMAYMDPKAPVDKQQARANFSLLLQQVRRNEHEGLTIPAELNEDGKPTGFRFRLVSTGGSRQIDVSKTIERLEKRIAMTVLTQFLFLGMDSVGSFSLSSDMTDIFAVALGTILDSMQETFNRFAVRELMELNGFPEEDWPTFEFGDIERPDIEKLAQTLKTLSDGGIITPDPTLEEFVRETLKLPPPDDLADPDDELALIGAEPAEPSNAAEPDPESAEEELEGASTGQPNGQAGSQSVSAGALA